MSLEKMNSRWDLIRSFYFQGWGLHKHVQALEGRTTRRAVEGGAITQ